MDEFCTAQIARINEMVDGPVKEKELVRLGKVQEGIRAKRMKFAESEKRRAEWMAKKKNLDKDGMPLVRGWPLHCTGGVYMCVWGGIDAAVDPECVCEPKDPP
jgi:hypothetical protein